MNTRNWIIAAVAVVLLVVIYFVVFQPGAEAPTEITAPPAATEPAPAQ
jgi:type II secretory pathway component PulM